MANGQAIYTNFLYDGGQRDFVTPIPPALDQPHRSPVEQDTLGRVVIHADFDLA